jgi:photosystem II stability/assembly factor-like uncharacterized protein
LTFTVGRDGTLWAGTVEGVFKSADKGRRWTRVLSGEVSSVIEAEEAIFAVVLNNGVFKSADRGTNWAAANRGLPPGSLRNVLRVFAARDGALYVDLGLVIYKSNDKAASWAATGPGIVRVNQPTPTETYVLSFAETQDGTILAGTHDGIFRSTDKGARWTRVLLLRLPKS